MPTRFPDIRKPLRLTLAACVLALAMSPAHVRAQCSSWSASGSADAADGSIVPGPALFYVMNFPQPGQAYYWGYAAARSPFTISGNVSLGGYPSSQHPVYAISTGYFTSPLGGPINCVKPEDGCGTCSGSFSLSLYATEGAIEGTVTVKPAPPNGVQGAQVWRSRFSSGTGAVTTSVNAAGRFEFRAQTEPARSNKWGVPVDGNYSPWPHSGAGSAQYYVGLAGSLEPGAGPVTVQSSQIAAASFTVRNPTRESPELRCTESADGGAAGPKADKPSESKGKPVHVITGNVYFDQTDVSVPGVQSLAFTRSYNSRLAYRNVGSALGRGWTHSYSRSLSFPDGISIDFRGDDGVPVFYQDLDADGVFEAVLPVSRENWITASGSGYTRHFRGGGFEIYDSAGRLSSIVDVAGNATTLARESSGRLAGITDAGGRSLALEYDASGRLVTLYAGTTPAASYAYDGVGWNLLESVRYPDGSGYAFTADSVGQILRVTDAGGRPIESHSYDPSGFGLTSELADGREKLTFTYEPFKTTVSDARGGTQVYHWTWVDALKRITKIEGPCSSCGSGGEETREWTYDARGLITSSKRAGEAPTSYTYDAEDRLISIQDPLGRTSTYTYDSQRRVLTASAPGGGLLTYTYGPHGPLTVTEKLTETTSRTTSYTYTSRGQVHTVTDPRGKVTTYAYTAAGDLESVTDPLGHTTTFEYDALGRRTKVTDALGHATSTAYDGRGRATRVTSADGTHT
jgi:YD repeat-containing protein